MPIFHGIVVTEKRSGGEFVTFIGYMYILPTFPKNISLLYIIVTNLYKNPEKPCVY